MAASEWDPEDRRRLHELSAAASRDFDTALRALAGGALAVSIAFVHQIAPDPRYRLLLGAAWLLFASSLALNLWSFLTGERASRRMLYAMRDPETTEIRAGKITDVLNWGSFVAFLGGLLGLVLFALFNV